MLALLHSTVKLWVKYHQSYVTWYKKKFEFLPLDPHDKLRECLLFHCVHSSTALDNVCLCPALPAPSDAVCLHYTAFQSFLSCSGHIKKRLLFSLFYLFISSASPSVSLFILFFFELPYLPSVIWSWWGFKLLCWSRISCNTCLTTSGGIALLFVVVENVAVKNCLTHLDKHVHHTLRLCDFETETNKMMNADSRNW